MAVAEPPAAIPAPAAPERRRQRPRPPASAAPSCSSNARVLCPRRGVLLGGGATPPPAASALPCSRSRRSSLPSSSSPREAHGSGNTQRNRAAFPSLRQRQGLLCGYVSPRAGRGGLRRGALPTPLLAISAAECRAPCRGPRGDAARGGSRGPAMAQVPHRPTSQLRIFIQELETRAAPLISSC